VLACGVLAVALSESPARGEDEPVVNIAGFVGCGAIGVCLYTDRVVSLEGSVTIVSHLRAGAKAWYWVAERELPREGERPLGDFAGKFAGVGPFVEAYARYRTAEFSARFGGGLSWSIPQAHQRQFGAFFELSIAALFYSKALRFGPRLGVATFAGQYDRFPTTPFLGFEFGVWF
jgi:hypothetical protein